MRLRELETQGLGPSTYRRPINHRLFFRFLNEERTEIQFYLFEHTAEQVIENYRQLWQVERTFRITKTDLKIRPIFHFKKRRIETHLSISFVTCKLYKEFGRQLKKKKIGLSAEKGLEETIFGITIKLPSGDEKLMLLGKTFDQKSILEHFR